MTMTHLQPSYPAQPSQSAQLTQSSMPITELAEELGCQVMVELDENEEFKTTFVGKEYPSIYTILGLEHTIETANMTMDELLEDVANLESSINIEEEEVAKECLTQKQRRAFREELNIMKSQLNYVKKVLANKELYDAQVLKYLTPVTTKVVKEHLNKW